MGGGAHSRSEIDAAAVREGAGTDQESVRPVAVCRPVAPDCVEIALEAARRQHQCRRPQGLGFFGACIGDPDTRHALRIVFDADHPGIQSKPDIRAP